MYSLAGACYPCGWTHTHCDIGNSVCGRKLALCGRSNSQLLHVYSMVDCPLTGTLADHCLLSGVMRSQVGIINRKAGHTQIMACIVTIQHAAV